MTVIVEKNVSSMFERLKQIRQNGMNLFDSLFSLQIEIVFIGQISPSERNLLVGFLPLVGAYNLESGGEGSLKFNLLKFSRKSRETLTTFFE